MFLFVQWNIFCTNKKEQINYVNKLNERFIKDGYYIYINNDIISIFYLKEEFQISKDISKIKRAIIKQYVEVKIHKDREGI